jgi:hypothetical protein
VGVLAQVDLRSMTIGRGEFETLLASLFFAGQILWLDRPRFAGNRVNHFTIVMFLTTVVLSVPVCIASRSNPGDWLIAFGSPMVLGLMVVLILLCTMVCILVMNRWQPDLPVTDAGLIYAMEPVSASGLALFLPGWFSAWGGFSYPNEKATMSLWIGGGLITAANILIQLWPAGNLREPR